jgi:hypothetical protein
MIDSDSESYYMPRNEAIQELTGYINFCFDDSDIHTIVNLISPKKTEKWVCKRLRDCLDEHDYAIPDDY